MGDSVTSRIGEPPAQAWIGARGSHGQPAKREPDRLVAA